MKKAVLISIHPKWCDLIASLEKTVEIRKTRPSLETPFKVYIYETMGRTDTPWVDEEGHMIFKGRGKIIGEFICDRIDRYAICGTDRKNMRYQLLDKDHRIEPVNYSDLRLSMSEFAEYGGGKELYGWHISNLKIYDQPKDPTKVWALRRVPQSWCYVEEVAEEGGAK